MKSFVQFSARRRTTSVFFASPKGDSKSSYTWIDNTPEVWTKLREVLEHNDPYSIAVNVDSQVAFSSGLHAGESMLLTQELGSPWKDRLVSMPMIAVEYIATMPKSQLHWYRKLMETAWAMISEAFSERVITPKKTTTEDVEWWLREKIQAMNYTTWFQPSVTILHPNSTMGEQNERPIDYEDLLHVDFGVTALGLNTDTQHLAYVLPPGAGKDDIPQGYLDGLKVANLLQDIVRWAMRMGKSGNDVLTLARRAMKTAGFNGRIYSHPIGDWGHSAGSLVGMTNLQDGVPVLGKSYPDEDITKLRTDTAEIYVGELPMLKNMYYSVELFAEHFVEERNATMKFLLEEDVYWSDEQETWEWVYGRQEKFHVIQSSAADGVLSVQEL